MKNNLLFLTKKRNTIHSLEVDLTRHMYNHFEDEDKRFFRNYNESLESYFISETLFDLLLDSFDEETTYEEDYGGIISSNFLTEGLSNTKPWLHDDDKAFKKEEIYELLKSGIKGDNINKFCNKLEKHGAEKADYVLSNDMVETYRKFLNHELREDEFANYSCLLCHILSYNNEYDDDDLNVLVADISWSFDGLAFGSDLSDEEEYYTNIKFFCYVKSCQRKIERHLFKKTSESNRINHRFVMYVFDFEWDSNMYLIHDTENGKFNFGFFNSRNNCYSLEYNYEFLAREEFYSLLEKFIAGEEDVERDECLTPKMILC